MNRSPSLGAGPDFKRQYEEGAAKLEAELKELEAENFFRRQWIKYNYRLENPTVSTAEIEKEKAKALPNTYFVKNNMMVAVDSKCVKYFAPSSEDRKTTLLKLGFVATEQVVHFADGTLPRSPTQQGRLKKMFEKLQDEASVAA